MFSLKLCSLCIVFSVVSLLVAKAYLSETVFAEEPALVNVAVNAVYASLRSEERR